LTQRFDQRYRSPTRWRDAILREGFSPIARQSLYTQFSQIERYGAERDGATHPRRTDVISGVFDTDGRLRYVERYRAIGNPAGCVARRASSRDDANDPTHPVNGTMFRLVQRLEISSENVTLTVYVCLSIHPAAFQYSICSIEH